MRQSMPWRQGGNTRPDHHHPAPASQAGVLLFTDWDKEAPRGEISHHAGASTQLRLETRQQGKLQHRDTEACTMNQKTPARGMGGQRQGLLSPTQFAQGWKQSCNVQS